MNMRVLMILLFVSSATTGIRSALSQTTDPTLIEQARVLFNAGSQAYRAGRFLEAAQALEEAYRITPYPQIAFSIAQAQRKQYFVDSAAPRLKRALELYRRYIAEVAEGGRRADAIQSIADLEPVLQRVEAEQQRRGMGPIGAVRDDTKTQVMVSSQTKLARVKVDGGEEHDAPAIEEVVEGKHQVVVSAVGYFNETREVLAVAGRLIAVEVNLRPMPARLALQTKERAVLTIDGRERGFATPNPIDVQAGKRLVTLSLRGHVPFAREVLLERGQSLTLVADLPITRQRRASYYVLGGAAGFAAVGIGTSLLAFIAHSQANDILDKRDQQNISAAELNDYTRYRDRSQDFTTASRWLFGGALVLGVTGGLLYYLDNPRPAESSSGMAAPMLGPKSAGFSWHRAF